MKKNGKISNAVIRRLPRYLRMLEELSVNDVQRVSSKELSEKTGYTASQIRQDLNHFGGFGQQGYGYNVEDLRREIEKILGLTHEYRLVIVGCGRLGRAIANFNYTYNRSFPVVGMFDVNPELIGKTINGVQVAHVDTLPGFLESGEVDIGVICVTKEAAEGVADVLIRGKVRGIWNFAPWDLTEAAGIPVENVHLSDGLQSLVFYINHNEK
ncbi:MAG: redox-sensing transcriptional repressor Rex [Bacillota bacterium]|nr:redox-sensing transcriptional repressor Rex [Eubacteriales bacterium]MDI9492374.1 redox-sensing transcriptional repressor Rex [Bacillota bacterium]NLV69619.1 redox-sensing transcriptional repressor Rex [Clostridiales bacterium]HRV33020.1 redox-sensing transcriptional repressor Rex [Anaerovoracaceae bacterium]MDD3537733.1 redox-sensing transcriptional repressor Rex [Eubacteriales bacterium]